MGSTASADGDAAVLARLLADFFAAPLRRPGRPADDRLAGVFIEDGKLINTMSGEPEWRISTVSSPRTGIAFSAGMV